MYSKLLWPFYAGVLTSWSYQSVWISWSSTFTHSCSTVLCVHLATTELLMPCAAMWMSPSFSMPSRTPTYPDLFAAASTTFSSAFTWSRLNGHVWAPTGSLLSPWLRRHSASASILMQRRPILFPVLAWPPAYGQNCISHQSTLLAQTLIYTPSVLFSLFR